MSDFVTLTCPSCGGKLQITKDIERFACAHCGNEHIVRRAGGVISLAPVVDGLSKVQAGVDKTASELAIYRLEREIDELGMLYSKVYDEKILSWNKQEKLELENELERILSVAKKKKAELDKHRKIVSS